MLAAMLPACGAHPVAPVAERCPANRAVVLASRADVARVAGCTALGGLALRSGAALDVSQLRALATVTGDLVIGPTIAIEEISLNGLRSVSGAIRVAGNGLLQGLYLPALERAGAIEIAGNAAIITISLPRLQAVRGALHITDNASLEMIDLSSLSSIDQDVAIAGDPRLHLLEAGQLERAAAVRLDAPMLAPDIADRLRATAALR